jgi:HK97 gp10 family phage protein
VDPVNEYDRYAADLTRAANDLDEDAEQAVERVAVGSLAVAQARVPVLTGRLRSEIRVRRRGLVVAIESPTPYAVFVEYGTSDTPPQPFMAPAFEYGAVRLVREVEKIRDEVVNEL